MKKSSKKRNKKKISETMNKIIPNFKPETTISKCPPSNKDSRTTSFHHIKEITQTNIKTKNWLTETIFIISSKKETKHEPTKEPNKGQGLSLTMWKIWKKFTSYSFRV